MLSSLHIPPPREWQLFESLCCDLWRRLWKDPETQLNGRSGQAQAGVDIYGRPGQGARWAGIQCKLIDPGRSKGTSLSRSEIETEVDKAKHFTPQISKYLIATSAKRDGRTQRAARDITAEQLAADSFPVSIMFWEDILNELDAFPDLIHKYFEKLIQSANAAAYTHSFPQPIDRFVGRTRELDDLASLIFSDFERILTISGPPGVGKTRLAIETSRRSAEKFPGGCWFVDLAPARSRDDILRAVARTLNFQPASAGRLTEAIALFLKSRQSALIILDNFEQVADVGAALVDEWKCQASHICFLVTSRSKLEISRERIFRLGALEIPDVHCEEHIKSLQRESVQLFIDRYRNQCPELELSRSTVDSTARICEILGGLPLAIELAAARADMLSPKELYGRLVRDLSLLASKRRDIPERQRTLMAAIEWSFKLLSEAEKDAFCQLSVFHGGFFLEAAEKVVATDKSNSSAVMDIVQSLKSNSLLEVTPTKYGPRFRMLTPLREFAVHRMKACSPQKYLSRLHDRFTGYYIEYSNFWVPKIHGAEAVEAADRVELEFDHLLSIHLRGLEVGSRMLASRPVLYLAEILSVRGPNEQIIHLARQALTLFKDSVLETQIETKIELLVVLAEAMIDRGDWDNASSKISIALELAGGNPELPIYARLVMAQASIDAFRGDVTLARQRFSIAEKAIGSSHGNMSIRARCLILSSWCDIENSNLRAAKESLEEALEIARRLKDRLAIARALTSLGHLHKVQNQISVSLKYLEDAEEAARAARYQSHLAAIVNNKGEALRLSGEYQQAVLCFEEAEIINQRLGNLRWLAANLHNKAMCYRHLGLLGEALKAYGRAEVLNRKTGNLLWLARNINGKGVIYSDMSEWHKALECVGVSEHIHLDLNHRQGYAYNLSNRGTILVRVGRFKSGIALIDQSERLNRATGERVEVALNIGVRGQALHGLGDKRAIPHLRESLEILRREAPYLRLYRLDFMASLTEAEFSAGNFVEVRSLIRDALDLAERHKLTSGHPAIWFVSRLFSIRTLHQRMQK